MTDAREELLRLRQRIDDIDNEILDVLVRRFDLTAQVGRVKKSGGFPPEDPVREAAMYERFREMARARNLDPNIIEDVYKTLISHVKQQHRQIGAT